MEKYTGINDKNFIEEMKKAGNGKVLLYTKDGCQKVRVRTNQKNFENTPLECTLYRGFDKKDDGIFWLLQGGTCIKSHYTEYDRMMREAYKHAPEIKDGENYFIVVITDFQGEITAGWHKAKVFGNYSDAAVFEEI